MPLRCLCPCVCVCVCVCVRVCVKQKKCVYRSDILGWKVIKVKRVGGSKYRERNAGFVSQDDIIIVISMHTSPLRFSKWANLPQSTRFAESLDCFKRLRKAHLYREPFLEIYIHVLSIGSTSSTKFGHSFTIY